MQHLYTEAATFTDGDLHAEFAAAARFYKELNDVAAKPNWDIERIFAALTLLHYRDAQVRSPRTQETSAKLVTISTQTKITP